MLTGEEWGAGSVEEVGLAGVPRAEGERGQVELDEAEAEHLPPVPKMRASEKVAMFDEGLQGGLG